MHDELLDLIQKRNFDSIICNPVLIPSKRMAAIISGLSNTEGGYIVLGAIRESNRFEIVGLSDDFNTESIISNTLNLLSPKPDIQIQKMFMENKNIYAIKVKRLNEPILFNDNKYIYEQSELVKCKGDVVLDKSKVFIVHGHDILAKEETARFVESLGLKAIILHEQASSGNTIIEKIEKHSNVGFAIVLYTPCDLGKAKNDHELNPRARQNVIFEHGYLMGKIGRNNVCALVKSQVEKPNDISGVVYVEMDTNGAWKNSLIKEMISSGYVIDANRLFS
ncbi:MULTISPECIES: TIR domain-containing protein [Lysinibacillus]|uniref:DNA-binding protein n=1 Tax=Lysinibacillus fusiformis TaxID=28031 RepID=A0A2I0UYY7_9BACI|nr:MULTISPECIES: TIR domain-containing protein [Lysinibacillus]PKU51246.1 DNA-binding protein [Lysinibacillus fusiformis]SCY07861.1 Putative DNA-binding domain-containing protein [Lysinibacillus sp. SG9]SDB13536.1 Putative DNA-binding domain-containing protein [Lysinibacillus sp. TC-37]SFS51985.1 Putative DNA-binding domain-containing protein [Lysinibacillus sp. SG55]